MDYLWNREKRAYATIDRKLAGVTVTLRQHHGVVIDPEATKAARELLKDYRKKAEEAEEPARGRGKAPAMRLDTLRLIVSKCDTDIFGLRDRAMPLLGFAIAARRAELAGLRLRNIRDDDIITAAGLRAGVEEMFTGHSVRSGFATEARRKGKDRKAIAAVTGHANGSKVLDSYMQIVDQWDEQDNALIGIGR
ncbi:tyrosine-type recombinase/integrase [Streptomyces sp. NPDC002896]|uniref:tyrosine-type recombinase/integrase n=1 Tax=Streptomyces sp. NPDC002896 TaxID=3154438 RepID=UPI003320E636